MTPRQEELTAGWLDGSLTPAEQEELLKELRADADFARSFSEEIEIHRGLQFSGSMSEEGERRAGDRILHYVRASQEGTRFVEGVKLRALAGGRRRTGRALRSGTSMVGPAIAVAAAVLVAALIGLLALAGHLQRKILREESAITRESTPEKPVPAPRETGPAPVEPKTPAVNDERRKEQIEDDLRRAAEARKVDPPRKPDGPRTPAPESPLAVPRPEAPVKPAPSAVEAPPALAKLEKVQGEATVNGDKAAAGAELRDGAALETTGIAVVRFPDGTGLDLSGEAKLQERMTGKRASGKGVTLARGTIVAEVAKQPAGSSFLFLTPHAEVQVVGTRLTIQSGAETRVDVQEGQVRVTALKGGQTSMLGAGQGLEVGAGAPRGYLSGLRAVYYDQNTFKGPTIERADREVDLALDAAKNELPPVGMDRNFGVRWEGRFMAEKDGEYVFILSVDGHVRFLLEGQERVADKKDYFHGIQRSVVRRRLAPGWHDLLIEYCDDDGNSRCGLRYLPPDAKLPDGENFQRDDSGWAIPPRLLSHLRK
ncbi:MAG TPA: FecR domain-containing protein [Planctomycetota bacterium]|nr:FecR domain-containing protein [Planctomycetota bacterium]